MQITLDVQDNRMDTFLALVKTLDYVSINTEKQPSQWQQDEVSKRLQRLENAEMKTRSWEEAQAAIFKR